MEEITALWHPKFDLKQRIEKFKAGQVRFQDSPSVLERIQRDIDTYEHAINILTQAEQ